jgi:GT2 family glycosyltransferase
VVSVNALQKGKVGIVTVTYNSGLVLEDFFASVLEQTHRNFVLYVVDNASSDKTLEMTHQRTDMPIVLTANDRNVGVAEGNNQGIRAALADGCEYVLLLNNDTVFPKDLIEQLYSGLERHSCEMTTGKIYYHDQPKLIWCAGGRLLPLLGYDLRHDGVGKLDTGQFEQPRRITYAPTCCLMVRRNVFERIGLMDSHYFVYFDDVDFLYRCLKRGVSLWYIPTAKLWHKVSSLTGQASDFTLRYCTRNRIYFVCKNLPYWLAFLWYLYSLSRSALAFMTLKNSLAKWRLRRASATEGWKRGTLARRGLLPVDR